MPLNTPSYLCDRYDRLHIWAAVRLCQEVTEYHGNATGIGFKALLAQNRAWVLSRVYYNIYRRPDAFEKIMLSTWSRGKDGLFAFRDYRIQSEAGEVLLTGTSYWPVIDFASRRAVRLNSLIAGYDYHDELATKRATLDKLRLPDMSDSEIRIDNTIRYSMLDHAGHVNNTEYIKWIFDSILPFGFDVDKPFSLELNYHHETQLGDTTVIACKQTADSIYAQISNSQGLSTTAKITPLS